MLQYFGIAISARLEIDDVRDQISSWQEPFDFEPSVGAHIRDSRVPRLEHPPLLIL